MKIDITGHSLRITNDEITHAAIFYANRLLTPNIINKIHLEINIRKMQQNIYGYCEWMDNSYRPKEFLITLSKRLSHKNLLIFLAHEMVHVRQYATNQLFDYISGNVRFCNQRYDTDNIDYFSSPWEIEAFDMQEKLYQEYLKDS